MTREMLTHSRSPFSFPDFIGENQLNTFVYIYYSTKFGIRLFEDPETGDAYKYEVNLAENRIYFDRTPNQPWYRYFDKGLERPIHLEAGRKYHARLIVDDSIAIMYIDGVSLIARMHAKAGCDLSAYVIDGSLKIENITIAKSIRS